MVMPTDPRPAVATTKRISEHQGVTVGESVNAIAEHFGPLTAEQCREIAAVMEWREAWATRELPSLVGQKQGLLEVILRLHAEVREAASALRREREENAATELQAASDTAALKFEVDHLRPLLAAAVADRDRYRAALEQVAERPTDFTLDAETNMCAVREYARVAPPPPAAQAEGERA